MKVGDLKPYIGKKVQVTVGYKNMVVGTLTEVDSYRCCFNDMTFYYNEDKYRSFSYKQWSVQTRSIQAITGTTPSDMYGEFLPKEESA